MSYNPDYSSDSFSRNPKANPLKKFRTYSYHHILMVTNSSMFVDVLNQQKGLGTDIYLHPDIKGTGSRLDVQNIQGHKYVVIANTMTDSNFIFQDIEIHTIVGAVTPSEGNPTVSSLFGNTIKMTVVEPFGTRFIEFILGACNALRIDQGQAIIVLKTIFVGHRDDGEIETISDYEAFPFIFQDIAFSFSSSGTTYTIEALPITNGIANLPTFTIIGGQSFSVEGNTIKHFVDAFNKHLKQVSEKARNEAKTSGKNFSVPDYVIILEGKGYSEPSYNLDNFIRGRDKTTANIWQYSVPLNTPITDQLYHVLGNCEKIQEEQKPKDFQNGVATIYTPLIHSKMVQVEEGNQVKTTFYYYIRKREQKVLKKEEAKRRLQEQTAAVLNSQDVQQKQKFAAFLAEQLSKSNLIEFDFIFSGKNDDVLRFDMLFEFGLGALYNSITPEQPVEQKKQMSSPEISTNEKGKHSIAPTSQNLVLPYTHSNPLKNPGAYEEFQLLLRRYALFETMTSQIEIMGNPRLFGMVVNDKIYASPQMERKNTEIIFPFFAKINVYMPRISSSGFVDFKEGNYDKDKSFADPFWYDGVFTIQEIVNKFSDGKFTQNLILYQAVTDGSVAENYVIESEKTLSSTTSGENENRTAISATSVNGAQQKPVKDTSGKCIKPLPSLTPALQAASKVQDFYRALRIAESSDNYKAVKNKGGTVYLGAYQMSYVALIDAGLRDRGGWKQIVPYPYKNLTNKLSDEEFLSNKILQDKAVREFHLKNWGYLNTKTFSVKPYIGTNINGLIITTSGLIAAAHLVGHAPVKQFLKSNGTVVYMDGNCVPLTHYLYAFANRDVYDSLWDSDKAIYGRPIPGLIVQPFDLNNPNIKFIRSK